MFLNPLPMKTIAAALMIISVPIQERLSRRQMALMGQVVMSSDKRIRLLTEILQGIRVIKFFSWCVCTFRALVGSREHLVTSWLMMMTQGETLHGARLGDQTGRAGENQEPVLHPCLGLLCHVLPAHFHGGAGEEPKKYLSLSISLSFSLSRCSRTLVLLGNRPSPRTRCWGTNLRRPSCSLPSAC